MKKTILNKKKMIYSRNIRPPSTINKKNSSKNKIIDRVYPLITKRKNNKMKVHLMKVPLRKYKTIFKN